MILVIAEKPDMAKKIAAVIGADQNRREWLEGSGYCVTWMYGHLLTLKVPEAAGRWKGAKLPILPEKWMLEPIPLQKREGQRDRLDVIRDLMRRCDSFVEATDAEREGELIFRNLYEYMGIRKPFKRLWISSLTEEAIAEGFRNLRPSSEYDNLAKAARQRERADWLVGINATRAFTRALGCEDDGEVMSLGRVQTPTLCIICDRFVENRQFKPELFWYMRGASVKGGMTLPWRETERHMIQAEAQALFEKVRDGGWITVTDINTERKTEQPPLLYDLAALQKAANTRYGYGMDLTLACAQSLYEKQLTTYPRTSSRYISEDVFKTIPGLMKSLIPNPTYGSFARDILAGKLNHRSVNDGKVTDHHALLITGRKPGDLPEAEANVYGLIVARMIESFSPVCVADITKVTLEAEGATFEAKGRKDVSLGWRAVQRGGDVEDVNIEEVDNVAITMRPLPQLEKGERLRIDKLDLVQDQTKPKPLLTDATLISAMENAGRRIDDKEAAEALKERGIGTAATRSEILKNLIERRKYVERKMMVDAAADEEERSAGGEEADMPPKKRSKRLVLVPTKLGLNVYAAIRDRSIAQVDLTAKWEMALEEIKEGKRDDREFEQATRKYTVGITNDILKAGGRIDKLRDVLQVTMRKEKVFCPKCGKELGLFEKSAWCRNPDCGFTVWRTIAGKKLSDDTLKKLIRERQTGLISGFKSKSGKTFDAYLKMDDEGQVSFEFPEKKGPKGADNKK